MFRNATAIRNTHEAVATLGAFASFAVGFAARPIGAVIFAHLGDRVGRRRLIIAVSMIGLVT